MICPMAARGKIHQRNFEERAGIVWGRRDGCGAKENWSEGRSNVEHE